MFEMPCQVRMLLLSAQGPNPGNVYPWRANLGDRM